MISTDSQRTARRLVVVLLVVFAATLPAVTPRIYASDEIEYFAFLRSAWFDRDFSFENEYRYFYDSGVARNPQFHETFLERVTPTGRRENFASIGCAILWAPFYGVADLAARSGIGQARWPADGYSWPYIAAVAYASAFYGFLALLAGWLIAVALVGDQSPPGWRRAVIPVFAVWFGTPLLFYMYIAPPMSHACSAFAVSAFVLGWLRVRRRWSLAGCAGLGVLAALMTMVREQDAFVAAGPMIDFVWTLVRSFRARRAGDRFPQIVHPRPSTMLLGAAAGAVGFAVAFLPQAIAYLAVNGRILPSVLVQRKMVWWSPHAWSVIASPEHGWFAWTPLALLAIIGLMALAVRGAQATRAVGEVDVVGRVEAGRTWATGLTVPDADRQLVALSLLAAVAAQVYIAGSVASWTVAGAFGQRRFMGLTALLVVGLTALLYRVRSRWGRGILAGLVVLCVWWNVGLMVQFGTGMMDRQRLELGRNARATFVELPVRLPRLAYRYLFDRASFYGDPGARGTQPQEGPR